MLQNQRVFDDGDGRKPFTMSQTPRAASKRASGNTTIVAGTETRYAEQGLTASGDAEALRRRHAECFLRLAEQAEPLLRGPQHAVWLRRLDAERANISAAIDWTFQHDPGVAVRLSRALAYFWLIGRHRSEVRRRLAPPSGRLRPGRRLNRHRRGHGRHHQRARPGSLHRCHGPGPPDDRSGGTRR